MARSLLTRTARIADDLAIAILYAIARYASQFGNCLLRDALQCDIFRKDLFQTLLAEKDRHAIQDSILPLYGEVLNELRYFSAYYDLTCMHASWHPRLRSAIAALCMVTLTGQSHRKERDNG